MKWFRITSAFWQFVILLSLAMLLGWDSEPVPGPNGRVVCELYEFPFSYYENYHSISLYQSHTPPGKRPNYGEIFAHPPLVDHAPILNAIPREPIKALEWLTTTVPLVKEILPKKYQYRIYRSKVMELSLSLEEWRCLKEARKEDATTLSYILHE